MNKPQVTCLLPTRARPQFLRRAIYFMRSRPDDIFLIADSSQDEDFEQNRETLERSGLRHVLHIRYDYDFDFYRKIADAIQLVETPFFYFLADDDFLFSSGIDFCVARLRENPNLVSVAGQLLVYGGKKGAPGSLLPSAFSIYPSQTEAEVDGLLRVVNHLSNYMATFYSVYRTTAAAKVFAGLVDRTTNLRLAEIMSSSGMLALGGREVLDCLFGLRTNHEDALHHKIPTLKEDLENPELEQELVASLQWLCDLLEDRSDHARRDLAEAIGHGAMSYLRRVGYDFERAYELTSDLDAFVKPKKPPESDQIGRLAEYGIKPQKSVFHPDTPPKEKMPLIAIALTEAAPNGFPIEWDDDAITHRIDSTLDDLLVTGVRV